MRCPGCRRRLWPHQAYGELRLYTREGPVRWHRGCQHDALAVIADDLADDTTNVRMLRERVASQDQ